MQGGYKKKPRLSGFTIIEVMIFLAVSGVTFLIAANFINGKEAQTEYYQGMNQSLADIRTVINNVSNGNYPFPDNTNFSCNVSVNGPGVQVSPTATSAASGCTLIGEVLAPDVWPSSGYSLFTLAGCMFTPCTATIGTPTSVYQEMPQVVPSFNQTKQWPGGVLVSKMFEVQPGKPPTGIGLVGFFASLPSVNGSVYQSGSQPVDLVVFTNSSLAKSVTAYENQINSLGAGSANGGPLTNGYVVICFRGTNGQPASITIGGNDGGQQMTASLDLGKGIYSGCPG